MDSFGFSVTTEHVNGTVLVRPSGELDALTAPQLARVLDGVMAHPATVVLDLSAVSFVDCAGLAPIRRALAGGPDTNPMRVVGARPKVDRVLHLSGLKPPHVAAAD